jgi:hypothetical protein
MTEIHILKKKRYDEIVDEIGGVVANFLLRFPVAAAHTSICFSQSGLPVCGSNLGFGGADAGVWYPPS